MGTAILCKADKIHINITRLSAIRGKTPRHLSICRLSWSISVFLLSNYPKALEYYHKSLAIFEKALGKTHPNTATSYNNIGSVYDSQGKYLQALEYHHKALAIMEKVLGKEHLSTAESYYNIALTLYKQKEYQESYNYMKKAVDIFKKRLGDNHPQTRFSINFLEEISKALPSFAELYFR